jgi:hypothetical protein
LSGGDLATFLAVATAANTAAMWAYGTVRYAVGSLPLYPDETDCPGTVI